jgi:hypothetical protein
MEYQKAQIFLDILVAWGETAPFYIHKYNYNSMLSLLVMRILIL